MSKANNDGLYDDADLRAMQSQVDGIQVAHSATGNVTGFVAGTGTAAQNVSVWAGSSGSSAYTVGDIVTALKAAGILAA